MHVNVQDDENDTSTLPPLRNQAYLSKKKKKKSRLVSFEYPHEL